MKINIKGFKGFLVRWALPILVDYLKQNTSKLSEAAREKLLQYAGDFVGYCVATETPFDDVVANVLQEFALELLGGK